MKSPRRSALYLGFLLFLGWGTLAAGQNRPLDFGEFVSILETDASGNYEYVGGLPDPDLPVSNLVHFTLNTRGRNLIQCGCTVCDSSCVSTDTYLYFPAARTNNNDVTRYRVTSGLTIDRSTSLFLAGSDQYVSILQFEDGYVGSLDANPLPPMFTVVQAPLVNVSNIRFRPDEMRTQVNDHSDGPQAFRFSNSSPTQFELIDTFLDRAKIDIEGPGSYRLQAVRFELQGAIDSGL